MTSSAPHTDQPNTSATPVDPDWFAELTSSLPAETTGALRLAIVRSASSHQCVTVSPGALAGFGEWERLRARLESIKPETIDPLLRLTRAESIPANDPFWSARRSALMCMASGALIVSLLLMPQPESAVTPTVAFAWNMAEPTTWRGEVQQFKIATTHPERIAQDLVRELSLHGVPMTRYKTDATTFVVEFNRTHENGHLIAKWLPLQATHSGHNGTVSVTIAVK